jgi:hypothetical protein
MLADWGKSTAYASTMGSGFRTRHTTPNEPMTAAAGATFVFDALPEYPTAGGAGTDAQEVTFSFNC